jgi:hypothetical protein
MSTDRSH